MVNLPQRFSRRTNSLLCCRQASIAYSASDEEKAPRPFVSGTAVGTRREAINSPR